MIYYSAAETAPAARRTGGSRKKLQGAAVEAESPALRTERRGLSAGRETPEKKVLDYLSEKLPVASQVRVLQQFVEDVHVFLTGDVFSAERQEVVGRDLTVDYFYSKIGEGSHH